MNNKIVEAIKDFKNGLSKLEEALVESTNNIEVKEMPKTPPVDISLLAERMAYSYVTKHPEFGVQSQYRNLNSMINSDKVSIIINWIRNYNVEGLENFFKLNTDDKVAELNKALTMFENEIKDILVKRFA